MADQDPIVPPTEGNGEAQAAGAQAATIAQYIKDFSAESPSAPQVFQWQGQPTLDVQFGINGTKVGDDVQEVVLKIDVTAKSDNGTHFIIDLSYGGLFAFRNFPDDALAPFLLEGGTIQGLVADIVLGLALAALSLPRGTRSKEHYGGWDRVIV